MVTVLLTDELWPTHVALMALYLRGAPRPFEVPRRRWPQVDSLLRAHNTALGDCARVLAREGLHEEAALLQVSGLLSWCEGRSCRALTPCRSAYPRLWLDRLGEAAPAALWFQGELPPTPLLGVVGSRHIDAATARFAHEVGATLAGLGYSLISGGAVGCDQHAQRGAAAAGASSLILLPRGLGSGGPWPSAGALASLAAPGEPFSASLAMERNALIYAAAEATVVVQARFRQGGTWHGAADALRRRLGPVLVRQLSESRAHRALIALGGLPLSASDSLGQALSSPGVQAALF